MSRGGRKSKPVYTIIATDSRSARNGKFIEKLGKYDPHLESPLSQVNTEALSKWVKNGAKLSDTVSSLLKKHKVQY